jgi:hypothetical protein
MSVSWRYSGLASSLDCHPAPEISPTHPLRHGKPLLRCQDLDLGAGLGGCVPESGGVLGRGRRSKRRRRGFAVRRRAAGDSDERSGDQNSAMESAAADGLPPGWVLDDTDHNEAGSSRRGSASPGRTRGLGTAWAGSGEPVPAIALVALLLLSQRPGVRRRSFLPVQPRPDLCRSI